MENKSNGKKPAEGRRGKFKKLLNRYGIAVALFACAAIVAGTWLFTDGNIMGASPSATPAPTGSPAGTASVQSDSQVAQSLEEAMNSLNSATPAPTASPAAAGKPVPDLVKPVKGSVMKKFATDTLLLNKTLNVIQTHSGVDIAGKLGDDVYAAMDGTVSSIDSSDPLLGYCVKVKCANDIELVYVGLIKSDLVQKGDKVTAGEIIGKIGNTALGECLDDPHLHFEVWVKGAAVNPEPYFRK